MTGPRPAEHAALAEGRYTLGTVLGQGGMATVYRGRDTRLEVDRAIKVLSPELASGARARFMQEARTMARLHHPGIVPVHDVGADGERAFIVMDLMPGGTLTEHLARSGPLPAEEVRRLGASVLRALAHAHDKGVVHRDIKPDNILLSAHGDACLTDFGIAQVVDRRRTRTGVVMGTWAFMPPEQRTDAATADARSDLFAVGAMLYNLATGREPFDIYLTDQQEELFRDVPTELSAVIRRATRYRAEQRYPDARAMLSALTGVSGSSIESATTVGADTITADTIPPVETIYPADTFIAQSPDIAQSPGATGFGAKASTESALGSLSTLQPADPTRGLRRLTGLVFIVGLGYGVFWLGQRTPTLPLVQAEPAEPVQKTPLEAAGVDAPAPVEKVSRPASPPVAPAAPAAAETTTEAAGTKALAGDASGASEGVSIGAATEVTEPRDTARPPDPPEDLPEGERPEGEQVGADELDALLSVGPDAEPISAAARRRAHREFRRTIVQAHLRSHDEPSGRILVYTEPWARVHVDGVEQGRTPWIGRLPLGAHSLKLVSRDGAELVQQVRIAEKAPVMICWEFRRDAPCGP